MPSAPFRFIHASDFHLDRPFRGLTDVPDPLVDRLLDAPFAAVRTMFEMAVIEEIDFVVLSGNLLDLQNPSAHSLAFLQSQFQLLHDHDIPVYWAGGPEDSDAAFPEGVALPDNVRSFVSDEVTCCWHKSGETRCAAVFGRTWGGSTRISHDDFLLEPPGCFTIAAASGKADVGRLGESAVNYWALGGSDRPETVMSEPRIAHYPGTPQGRSPKQIGPHGCTLVEVTQDGKVGMRMVPCDSVRWQRMVLPCLERTDWALLEDLAGEAMAELGSESGDRTILLDVVLEIDPARADARAVGPAIGRFQKWLRSTCSQQSSSCWPAVLRVDSHHRLPDAWFEEDSLLGDFLRAARQREADESSTLLDDANPFADRRPGEPAALPDWVPDLDSLKNRKRIAREATALGSDLLRGAPLPESGS